MPDIVCGGVSVVLCPSGVQGLGLANTGLKTELSPGPGPEFEQNGNKAQR
jgi:hypothetical protein